MSDADGIRQRVDSAIETGSDEANAADAGDLSDAGVGLIEGEPNTFEPEEAAPAADDPTE